MLADISLALSSLKMISTHKGKIVVLTPDDLYSRYIEFLPLLTSNAMTWSFSLVTLFFHALPSELQVAVQSGVYGLPDLSTLLTSSLQEQKLQRLREKDVIAHKLLEDEGKRIRKLMTTFSTKSASNSLQMEANCHYQNNSLAEQTLAAQSTPRPDKPLVKGTDGRMYPKNPFNGYISRFPDEFTRCLGCGSTEHRFRECPRSTDKDLREIFWHEMWAHIPTTRKKPSPPFATTNSFISSPSISFNPPLPSCSNSNSVTWQEHRDAKRPHFFTLFARISNISASKKKPMPISINNSLPSVSILLGLTREADNGVRMLVDTGASMNSGYLDYHLWVMYLWSDDRAYSLPHTVYCEQQGPTYLIVCFGY